MECILDWYYLFLKTQSYGEEECAWGRGGGGKVLYDFCHAE